MRGLYDTVQDRVSAYETLQSRAQAKLASADESEEAPAPKERREAAPRAANRQSMGEAFAKSMLRTIGSQVGREIIRGVLGGLAASSRGSGSRRR